LGRIRGKKNKKKKKCEWKIKKEDEWKKKTTKLREGIPLERYWIMPDSKTSRNPFLHEPTQTV
jgi:hypothetical protein